MKNILKLLAVQTFFLFDKNKIPLLLPQTEVSLTSTSQIRARILLLSILQASQAKKLIEREVTLWGFIEAIREDFKETFTKRSQFLENHTSSDTSVFPYPTETFLLDENLTITEDMVRKEAPVKPQEEEVPVSGIRLTGIIIDHEDAEAWRKFDAGNESNSFSEENLDKESEFIGNPV